LRARPRERTGEATSACCVITNRLSLLGGALQIDAVHGQAAM
jgi:hypothetical protein